MNNFKVNPWVNDGFPSIWIIDALYAVRLNDPLIKKIFIGDFRRLDSHVTHIIVMGRKSCNPLIICWSFFNLKWNDFNLHMDK